METVTSVLNKVCQKVGVCPEEKSELNGKGVKMSESGISSTCELALKEPATKDVCLDFRAIRRKVMCASWRAMAEEKIPFRDAVRKSWAEIKAECQKAGVFSPEPVEPEKAVALVKDGEVRGVISLMEDGKVEVCVEERPCEITSDKTGYYIAQAWMAGLGYGIKPLEE